ncbi:MAG: CapA family protein [Prevotella sp.]|nr:CapA family protein [Prevotella sp.]
MKISTTVTKGADYSIVNFECPVADNRCQPIAKYGPNLRCSKRGVEAVKWAGFDCVTLANNHFLDYGEGGYG